MDVDRFCLPARKDGAWTEGTGGTGSLEGGGGGTQELDTDQLMPRKVIQVPVLPPPVIFRLLL